MKMKRIVVSMLFFFSVTLSFASCKKKGIMEENRTENTNSLSATKVKIKVGEKTFTAALLDNPTAAAFKTLLPLTISMKELNNNEKYADLPKSLPANATVPTSIQAGDLMMYGSNTLVLFYKSFSTTYSYTKLGKIDDVTGLVTALGAGDVKVSIELVTN
jgi:hypothetical protein